jgi:MFS family permease
MARRFPINVYMLSFSAFFADMGYQIVVGGLSVFLVLILHAPIWVFALIEAISYGFGSVFSYIGGRLADRFGPKNISIIGNALIPILSFTGFMRNYVSAGAVYIGGWWPKNFRSPPRRTLMIESTSQSERTNAFALLHSLDVAGGIIASVTLITLFSLGFPFSIIFALSIFPLIISTLLIILTKPTKREPIQENYYKDKPAKHTYYGIMFATALFGFSYYSIGFPILTAAQDSTSILYGLILYPIFMSSSAFGGFIYSRIKSKNEVRTLGFMGYILSGLATFGIFAILILKAPFDLFYVFALILGFGTSAVETFEPAIVSRIVRGSKAGSAMGTLSFFRSIGMFSGNIIVGLLYIISPEYSYLYASAVAVIGGISVILAGRNFRG